MAGDPGRKGGNAAQSTGWPQKFPKIAALEINRLDCRKENGMGCSATVWTRDRKRCLICNPQYMPYETPCPRSAEHIKKAERGVASAVACAEALDAKEFRFRTNGGSMTHTMMQLWLKNLDGWLPTEVAFYLPEDRGEIFEVERALRRHGLCASNEWPALETPKSEGETGTPEPAILMAIAAVVAAILLFSVWST